MLTAGHGGRSGTDATDRTSVGDAPDAKADERYCIIYTLDAY
jgi:hypothetical protein